MYQGKTKECNKLSKNGDLKDYPGVLMFDEEDQRLKDGQVELNPRRF